MSEVFGVGPEPDVPVVEPVYQAKGGWYFGVDGPDGREDCGPYDTREQAERARAFHAAHL